MGVSWARSACCGSASVEQAQLLIESVAQHPTPTACLLHRLPRLRGGQPALNLIGAHVDRGLGAVRAEQLVLSQAGMQVDAVAGQEGSRGSWSCTANNKIALTRNSEMISRGSFPEGIASWVHGSQGQSRQHCVEAQQPLAGASPAPPGTAAAGPPPQFGVSARLLERPVNA